MDEFIFHIITQSDWDEAIGQGYYRAKSVDSEGFMHCSRTEQVEGVLERYYANQSNLYKLTIQSNLVKAPIQYEIAPSINQLFPHIYGNLNIDAVIEVEKIC